MTPEKLQTAKRLYYMLRSDNPRCKVYNSGPNFVVVVERIPNKQPQYTRPHKEFDAAVNAGWKLYRKLKGETP